MREFPQKNRYYREVSFGSLGCLSVPTGWELYTMMKMDVERGELASVGIENPGQPPFSTA
jgi:hypothetical protein